MSNRFPKIGSRGGPGGRHKPTQRCGYYDDPQSMDLTSLVPAGIRRQERNRSATSPMIIMAKQGTSTSSTKGIFETILCSEKIKRLGRIGSTSI